MIWSTRSGIVAAMPCLRRQARILAGELGLIEAASHAVETARLKLAH
ncbi:hypothetical protein ABZ318_00450 [Streptomyces sp. NPDC006197]